MALALLLAACGGGSQQAVTPSITTPSVTAPSTAPTTLQETTTTMPPTTIGELPEADRAVVDAATADLADRLDVTAEEIAFVLFERVTWPDGSLGCPKPGMMYTQALVEGSRTLLTFDGVEYPYHAGRDDRPFLCEQVPLKPRY